MFPKPPGIPVFVMLPLDSVNADGAFKYASSPWFAQSLHLLANSGAYGVAVDVWWGAVEREPCQYTWTGYKQLLELIRPTGLKLQIVLSFHACGGNVGDTAHIPLPQWVLRCGENDPDVFFTDRPRGGSQGQRNREYLSVWADDAGVLHGRSPMQCYEDFMASFRDTFLQDLGCMVEEVVVGAGPCGELRFPSYVEANGWRFPGVGEFQCYDRRALASLAAAARERGCPEWGFGGPHDTGDYNSNPEDTGFYNHEGSWDSPYGRFFLGWYSGSLMEHGDKLMAAAKRVFAQCLPPHKGGTYGLVQPSPSSSTQQQGAGALEAGPSVAAQGGHRLPGAGGVVVHAGQQGAAQVAHGGSSGGGSRGSGSPVHASDGLCAAGPATGVAGSTGSAMHTSTASEGARSDGDGQSEAASSSGMSLPDQDAESDGHASSDRSSGMVQAGACPLASAGPGAPTTNCTPGAPASLGTISQQSDCTDVAGAHAGAGGDPAVQDAVDRTCSTVSMFNLLGDDNASSECMTPDNASAAATEEAGHHGEGQHGDEARPAGSGRGTQGQAAGAGPGAGAGPSGVHAGGGPPNGTRPHATGSGARPALGQAPFPRKDLTLTLKIAGIHWWFRSRSHAAELTAGYYNTATRDGYGAVVELCVKHQFSLTLTCVEMCDTQHPPPAQCGPEGLLKQVRSLCAARGVPLSGENALPIFLVDGVDSTALDRIVYNTRVWHGAAAMSAYWHARKLERSSSPEPQLGSRDGERSSDGGTRAPGVCGGGGGGGGGASCSTPVLPHQHQHQHQQPGLGSGGGYRRQPVHCGSGPLPPYTMYNTRPHPLPPVRSDPAIAATGLRGDSYADISEPLPPMRSFTFLRLAPQILQPSYQTPWMKFMWKMREGGFC